MNKKLKLKKQDSVKKASFITLGCRLNQSEEELLRRKFLESGFLICESELADFIIVNTCSVTALADKKSRQVIRKLKKENRKAKIVAIGCGAETTKEMPEVDLVIFNKDKNNVFNIVLKAFDLPYLPKHRLGIHNLKLNSSLPKGRTRSLLKIQDGCNNFCTYCIVPYLRGREISLPADQLVKEAKKLEKIGYKELVISGVNVGRYNYNFQFPISNLQIGDNVNLINLIKLILSETNFSRIKLSSINPDDINGEMINLWKDEKRLCRHLHLSLQSGSDSVLKRMGRPYTVHKYYSLVKNITQKIPDIAITTDVIVGFPGETEKEFKETCNFIKKVGFAKLHVFPYSKREGTKAAEMQSQIDSEIKKKRAKDLRKIGNDLRREYINQFINQELEVLFEEKKGDYWFGLTSNYIRIKYKSSEDLANKIRKIKISNSNVV